MSVRMMLTYAFIGVNTCDRLSDSCCIQVLLSATSGVEMDTSLWGFLWQRKVSGCSSLFCSSGLLLLSNPPAKILSGGAVPVIAMEWIKMTIFTFVLYRKTGFKICKLIQEVN